MWEFGTKSHAQKCPTNCLKEQRHGNYNTHNCLNGEIFTNQIYMTGTLEDLDEYRQAFFVKLNEALRKEGFTEVQIAKIDTAVRRAINL
jgi:hypothetical protein